MPKYAYIGLKLPKEAYSSLKFPIYKSRLWRNKKSSLSERCFRALMKRRKTNIETKSAYGIKQQTNNIYK